MKNMVKQGFSLLAALALAMGLSVTAFAAESSVTWEPEKQVSFERGSDYSATDLFDNFKGMMPGDSTSQTITLTNNSDFDYIRVYMRAVPHDDENPISDKVLEEIRNDERWDKASGDELAYMNDFLSKLNLTVKNGDTVIFDGAPNSTDGLDENVYLGTLALKGNKTATLTAELSVPIELGNEYSNRIGEVDWAFVVEGFHTSTIEIKPATITIYQGGNGGYDAVVGEGDEVVASDSLPTPMFYITDPRPDDDNLNADDLIFSSQEKLPDSTLDDPQFKSWRVEKAGTDEQGVPLYYMEPVYEGQDPVRVEYTRGDETFTSDDFDVTAVGEMYADYDVQLYTNKVDVGNVTAHVENFEDIPFPVDASGKGTLHVRAVEGGGSGAENPVYTVSTPTEELDPGTAAVDGNDSTYTLNETSVPVESPDKVGLLFDDIIDDGVDRTGALLENTDDYIGDVPEGQDRHYQAKYLNLVDTANGNAWVKASNAVTVYWAYPEGTDQNTDFRLTHFVDLHRDNSEGKSGYDISDIDSAETETISITKDEYGITFDVPTAGFSPFVLTWETDAPGNLSVTKTVSGTAGDQERSFDFKAVLSDKSINGTFGDMTFTNGEAAFTLAHGETKTAVGLPAGVSYVVTELDQDQDGYATTYVGEQGVIESDQTVAAAFVNHKDAPGDPSTPPKPETTIPQTGDTSDPLLMVGLMMISGIGIVAILILMRRRHKN